MKSLRVLVIPDKFKGTLTARQAAQAIADGWQECRPDDHLDLLPMSDGGDGFGEVMSELVGAKPIYSQAVDAAHRPTKATWWWQAETGLAIIESARVVGLAMLPTGLFHPFQLDTQGLALVIQEALRRGARECLVGIGGSATNDGGFGMATALGWQFFSSENRPIQQWTELEDLNRVLAPPSLKSLASIRVAVDVQNPMLGPNGCSRIYGPQKGLRDEQMPQAEACLGRLAQRARPPWSVKWASVKGAGAAGGLGFGLRCFCRAKLVPGFSLFAQHSKLASRLRRANLIITGEGRIDASSLMGKGVGEVVRWSGRMKIPCLGLGGGLGLLPESHGFQWVKGIAPELISEEEAKANPEYWLRRLAAMAARNL